MRMGAVIVGAGMSKRMKDFKPFLPFADTTIARHVVSLVKETGADPILLVTGYRGEEMREHLSCMGIRFLYNERYETTQMFDSVCLGIEAIYKECDKILLMPIDTPAIREDTFTRVISIDADMVRTVYGEEPGHPILLRSEVAKELCSYKGNRGLRGAMEESRFSITNLVVDDKGVNWDVDTPKDYQELLSWQLAHGGGYPISPKVSVSLATEEVFFQEQAAVLLGSIASSGSLQEACKKAGVSYSKGSRMIKSAEEQLGFSLLERWSGGSGGGGSRLTKEGESLLASYERLREKVQADAKEHFKECFGAGLRGGLSKEVKIE